MVEEIIQRLAERPDVVRVAVSDREGLLIASSKGGAQAATPTDAAIVDDLWSAYLAQFAANMSAHLKSLTLSRPMEMVVHGTADALLIVWLNVGWLIARVASDADWPAVRTVLRGIQDEFDALTGEPVYAEDNG